MRGCSASSTRISPRMSFSSGTRPSIGDFGLYGPLYAHQYRDPVSGALMKRIAPNVARWVERMSKPPRPKGGEFLANDDVPATLMPVLARIMREYLPVLLATAEAFNAHVAALTEADRAKPLARGIRTARLHAGRRDGQARDLHFRPVDAATGARLLARARRRGARKGSAYAKRGGRGAAYRLPVIPAPRTAQFSTGP